MGPLSVKAQVQANAGRVKDQMTVIKTLSDEARKKDLHKIKMAKEIAKAKAEGIPIDESAIGFADGKLTIPKLGSQQPDTTLKSNSKGVPQESTGIVVPKPGQDGPSVTLNNPEAGPSDTIPAMLTPGEAVIPASVAQDSAYKPVIEALVEEGRMRNRQPGGVKGFADGTDGVGYEPGNRDSFMSYYDPYATSAAERLGVDKSIILAQLGQETGWGKKTVGTHNLGNIKDFNNREGSVAATDKVEGSRDKYRSYANPQDFFDDYTSLLEQKFPGVKGSGSDVNKFVAGLTNAQGQKYATDPEYGAKLSRILGKPAAMTDDQSPAETARLAAQPVPPPVADRVEAAQFANRWSTPIKAGSTTGVDTEITTLKRYIENPSTPANERGKARLRLAELERHFNDKQTIPALGREYRGTAVPAGSSAIPGQTVSTVPALFEKKDPSMVPPPVAPKQEVPAPTPKVPNAVISPDDQSPAESARLERQSNQVNSVLEDPNVQTQLAQLQQTPPPPGVDAKDWLSKGLAKIFGKTGMFNEEDLIRFSLLAAGGMLTGGSVGGSIRFAGLHTLKASDERRSTEAAVATKQAAALEQQKYLLGKDQLDRNQKLEDTFHSKMDKADPQVKDKATQLLAQSRDPKIHPALREAKLTAAINLLAANQVDDKKPGTMHSGYDSKTDTPIQYYYDNKNNMIAVDPTSGKHFSPTEAKMKIVPDSVRNSRRKEQDEIIVNELTHRLDSMNRTPDGKEMMQGYKPKEHAQALSATFDRLREYMGYDADPKAMAKIVDHAVSLMPEEYRGVKLNNLSPEALSKMVMGSAVMDARPSAKELYKVPGEGSGRPGREATLLITDILDKSKAEGRDPAVLLSALEAKYKGLPDAQKKKFESDAKASPGWSPYLLWVKGQMNK